MPITDYTLTTIDPSSCYKIRYKNGKMSTLTHVRGALPQNWYDHLLKLVPQAEIDISDLVAKHCDDGNISWKLITQSNKTLFTRCMIEYQLWYEEKTSMPPKIDGISGNALKAIIAHLTKQSTNEEEAYQLWLHILNSWHLVAEFYRQQKELRQINSNINTILNHIKNGKEESTSNIKDLQDTFRSKDGAG